MSATLTMAAPAGRVFTSIAVKIAPSKAVMPAGNARDCTSLVQMCQSLAMSNSTAMGSVSPGEALRSAAAVRTSTFEAELPCAAAPRFIAADASRVSARISQRKEVRAGQQSAAGCSLVIQGWRLAAWAGKRAGFAVWRAPGGVALLEELPRG